MSPDSERSAREMILQMLQQINGQQQYGLPWLDILGTGDLIKDFSPFQRAIRVGDWQGEGRSRRNAAAILLHPPVFNRA